MGGPQKVGKGPHQSHPTPPPLNAQLSHLNCNSDFLRGRALNTDEEDQQTRNLLSQIRENILRMSNDIGLILKAYAQ